MLHLPIVIYWLKKNILRFPRDRRKTGILSHLQLNYHSKIKELKYHMHILRNFIVSGGLAKEEAPYGTYQTIDP